MKAIPSFLLLITLLITSCDKKTPLHVGTWRFVADQEINSEDKVINQDTSVNGMLIYTADGNMSVQLIWKGTRQPMMSDSIMKHDGYSTGLGIGHNTWTPEQNSLLIDTYDGYFGTYAIDVSENIVTHTVNGNLRPEKTPVVYKRKFFIKGDTLFLRSVDPTFKWQAVWVKTGK